MRRLLTIILILFFVFPSVSFGWNPFKKNSLDNLELASENLENCECNQVVPSDCEKERDLFAIAKLDCKKEKDFNTTVGERRMRAAISLGRKKAKRGPCKTMYSKIYASLNSEVIEIGDNQVDENYLIYTDKCTNISSTFRFYVFWTDLIYKNVLHLFFIDMEGERCFDHLANVDEKFTIITKEQLEQIKENINFSIFSKYQDFQVHKVQVHVYPNSDSEKIKSEYDELWAKKYKK